MKPLAARQPPDKKRSTSASRAFLLKIELRSNPKLLCVLRGAMEPLMEMLGFSPEHCRSIIRAVDEAVSNIMKHAYHGRGDEPIDVSCNRILQRTKSKTVQGVEILLSDRGPAVDPTKLQARSLDEIRPGGLGLHIIRGSMDTVEYKRSGRTNRLRLVKYDRPLKRRPNL